MLNGCTTGPISLHRSWDLFQTCVWNTKDVPYGVSVMFLLHTHRGFKFLLGDTQHPLLREGDMHQGEERTGQMAAWVWCVPSGWHFVLQSVCCHGRCFSNLIIRFCPRSWHLPKPSNQKTSRCIQYDLWRDGFPQPSFEMLWMAQMDKQSLCNFHLQLAQSCHPGL